MAIRRDNILSMIGNGRYHSCILTTFSFDFYFFEMKVMKWLRSAGVRNVNVLADGHYYAELMQHATGDEMKFASGYSIYPVFGNNIFHPKIWMLFGKNEGLLIVGSGNLTSSGNGNNDELWGAYHFDVKQTQHAALFSAAWEYLSKISSSVKGVMSEKTTRWIAENAQWLHELPKPGRFKWISLSADEQIAFLYNNGNDRIWQQLTELIGKEKITAITAVSPFYDAEGKALEQMRKYFPDAQINVVLDENGSIPSSLPHNRKYSFYDWKEMGVCRGIGQENKTRLHAKMLVVTTRKGTEYLLLGSANITPAGLGLQRNANAEACVFIRALKGGLINRTGLKIGSAKTKPITSFAVRTADSIYERIVKQNRYPIKLQAAEIGYGTLTIFSTGSYRGNIVVRFYDNENRSYEAWPVGEYAEEIEVKAPMEEHLVKYIELLDANGRVVVSNKIIVSFTLSLNKTHPSPKNEGLEHLCNQLQNGELRNVLDLIHYAIIDETEKEDGSVAVKTAKPANKDKKERTSKKLYKLEDYRQVQSSYERSILLSPSLRILDVVKIAHGSGFQPVEIASDEQEENIGNISGNEEHELPKSKDVSLMMLESDKRKLRKFFKDLYGYFHDDILYQDTKKVSSHQLTLTDLTKYLIALELIHEFGGKSERVESEQSQLFFTYLPATGNYDNDNVKGCCLNIIGDFLRLARNGFKQYSFEYTIKKFEQLKYDALVSTIVCILNVPWRDDEQMYIKTLLLNSLHYLGWNSSEELNKNMQTLLIDINIKISKLKQRTARLKEHCNFFTERVCHAYRGTTQKREQQQFSAVAEKGQIIYSSVAGVGYCYVVSVSAGKQYCLARPGFAWNDDHQQYINHFGHIVYSPLVLPSVMVVDI